jgi:hypothetical protein
MISTIKRHLLGLVLLATGHGAAFGQSFVLVTEQEAAASRAAGGMITPRVTPRPGAPRIELVSPDVSRPVGAPTDIEVKFFSTAPAEAIPESFKVLYGAFRIDITQRLLGVARVTRDGIRVSEAVLPSGNHQLTLSIADSVGRESVRMISFSVKK